MRAPTIQTSAGEGRPRPDDALECDAMMQGTSALQQVLAGHQQLVGRLRPVALVRMLTQLQGRRAGKVACVFG